MFTRSVPSALAACLLIAAPSFAQRAQVPRWTETAWPLNKTVGPRVNPGASREVLESLYQEVPLAIIRLKFASWTLPPGTAVRLTSPKTQQVVEMNAEALQSWGGFTPMFSDDALFVELVANPGAPAAGFVLASVNGIRMEPWFPGTGPTDNICGTDDRTRSNATGVARFWVSGGLCTASLIATGDAAVSAGHCGNPTAGSFVEFDPPDSSPVGATILAPVENQFPVDTSRVQRNFTWVFAPCPPPNQAQQCIQSFGQDALAFGLNRNTWGQSAGIRRGGHMRIARASTFTTDYSGTKWGCGTATGANNLTMKFLAGTVEGARVNRDGGAYWKYSFDTTGGDSGGPLVHPTISASLGVISSSGVTGCDSGAYAFSNAAFTTAIETLVNQGSSRFVDSFNISAPGETVGSIWAPSTTFRSNAYDAVPTNGTVYVAPGTFAAGTVLSRPATIRAPFGPVTLIP